MLPHAEGDNERGRGRDEVSVQGGLQSVLDEYARILQESLGLIDNPPEKTASEIGAAMISAITLRTSSLGVDDIQANGRSWEIRSDSMRGRFAMRFGEEKNEGDSQVTLLLPVVHACMKRVKEARNALLIGKIQN